MRCRMLALATTAAMTLAGTVMPVAASSISLSCTATTSTTSYTGTVHVNGNRLAGLQVGQTITYRNGLSGTITSVSSNTLQGTATLSSGEAAVVNCTT
jgi:hypothetical protein